MPDFSCSMSMIAVTYSTKPIQITLQNLIFPTWKQPQLCLVFPILCLLCMLVKILCSCLNPISLYTKFQHAISYSELYHKLFVTVKTIFAMYQLPTCLLLLWIVNLSYQRSRDHFQFLQKNVRICNSESSCLIHHFSDGELLKHYFPLPQYEKKNYVKTYNIAIWNDETQTYGRIGLCRSRCSASCHFIWQQI
jgi:hypothetical protein